MTQNENTSDALVHPNAVGHLPVFVTPPGGADWLLVAAGILLLVLFIAIGVFYLRLHHLPDHLADRGQKVQYEIVSVLVLIAMFTHNNAYWIAALLLALMPIPNFLTPINAMAQYLARMAAMSQHRRTKTAPKREN